MSAAAEATANAPSPTKSKKKLLVMLAAIALIVLIGGGTAVYMINKKAAEAAAYEDDEDSDSHEAAKREPGAAPVYVPLDPFVVNLADREAERYAQVGVTLEVDDAEFADEMKVYMPSIRNAILMILAHKRSSELVERAGKEALASEIMRAVVRPMGIEIAEPTARPERDHDDESDDVDDDHSGGRKKAKRRGVHNPVQKVHFSSFIVQ
jgi:flagellar FliL protein